jgi:hypothetical protein
MRRPRGRIGVCLPKNTLTTGDAKVVEERFQASLSTIRGDSDPHCGPSATSGVDSGGLVLGGAMADRPDAYRGSFLGLSPC